MERWTTGTALCIGLLEISCLAQQVQKHKAALASRAESKAYVKHTKDGDVFVTENASFDFAELLNDDGTSYTSLRVRHTDHIEWNEWRDGVQGTVTVSAWPVLSDDDYKPLWTFHSKGTSGQTLPGLRMFRVMNSPCCSEPFKNIYFSLLDGRELYTTNGVLQNGDDPGLLSIAGEYDGRGYTKFRHVGFGAAKSVDDVPTLQYGTDKAIRQRFALVGREYGDNFDVPALSIAEQGKGRANYVELSGPLSCTLLLTFADGPVVRIPIENDVVRADKAILPDGYSLREERPASNSRK